MARLSRNGATAAGCWVRVITDFAAYGFPEQRLYLVRTGSPVEAENLVRAFIGDLKHTELTCIAEARRETIDRLALAPGEVWFA